MIDAILQNPFLILLSLILIVSFYGLISSERAVRRNSQDLIKFMSMFEFNTERCCDCARRGACRVYMEATGFMDENDQS